MTRTGYWFVGGLWALGLAVGIGLVRWPDAVPLPMPYFIVPLAAGLLVELALRPAINAGRMPPLAAHERAIGVLGGAIVAFATMSLLRA